MKFLQEKRDKIEILEASIYQKGHLVYLRKSMHPKIMRKVWEHPQAANKVSLT